MIVLLLLAILLTLLGAWWVVPGVVVGTAVYMLGMVALLSPIWMGELWVDYWAARDARRRQP